MLAIERHRRLLELLQKSGSVRTVDAARTLQVTEETVRRDFEKLEAEGALLRSHGGAVRLESVRREVSEEERAHQHMAAKRLIARAAAARIREGQTILFDASTTSKQVVQMLPDQPLTVLTNGLQIALILAEKPSIHVILLGGSVRASSFACTGWSAEQLLDTVRVDTAYVSCRGFDPVRGASEATEEHARLKRRIVDRAEEVCLLADHSKIGLRSSYFYARPCDIDLWITEKSPPEAVQSVVTEAGIRVEIAGKEPNL
jgi:DeoR/GlpR family transcriptional regulator of sugar metabolism